MDKLVMTILAAVDAYEREQRAAITKARMRLQQRNGLVMTRPDRPPFGYYAEEGRLHRNAAEFQTLERLLELSGEAPSHAEVARRLNAEGLDCRGREWNRPKVRACALRGVLV